MRLALYSCLLLASAGLSTAATAPTAPFDGLVLPFKEVVVSSPVQSKIDHIFVKEGDHITLGQPLAQLESRVEELDMQRAHAAVEKKEFDFKSSKNLFNDKIVSEDEALKNKLELEQARLAYEIAAELFHERLLKAPVAGIVVEKMHEEGEAVTASQPVFRLVDISQVYVQFYIRAEDLPLIHEGDTMEVRCPVLDPHKVHRGKVDFIDPRIDAASGLMRVKVLLPNPTGEIKAGVRAEVSLTR